MDVITLNATARESGKKHARAARRNEEVPCVLYGHHVDPVLFQVPELSLRPLIYTAETHRVEVQIGKESWDCILKDVVLHPTTERPFHADFQVLQQGETIQLTVPIQFEGTPVGQKEGGDTQTIMNEIEVVCLPKDIPSHISVDISDLNIGDAIHVSDLGIEGVEFVAAPERTVVTVVAPRRIEEEVEEEGLVLGVEGEEAPEAEGGAGEEGEEDEA